MHNAQWMRRCESVEANVLGVCFFPPMPIAGIREAKRGLERSVTPASDEKTPSEQRYGRVRKDERMEVKRREEAKRAR